jgi:cysteine-rich repeat protein
MRAGMAVASLVAMLLASHPAQARPLVQRVPGALDPLGEPGIRRRALLALDPDALAALRQGSQAHVEAFPLARDRDVSLDLVRTEPLRNARLEEMTPGGVRALTPPDTAYFVGTVVGEPGSRALVAAGPARLRGFVVSGGTAYLFGPDARGTLRSYDLRDVDETVHPGPGAFCDGDLHAALVRQPLALRAAPAEAPAAAALSGQLLRVDVAIETDTELRSKFTSSTEALDYVAALVAAANTIYELDLGLQLNASYVRLWTTTDPWTATSTDGQLNQLQAYWTDSANDMPAIAGPRAVVHMLSGKTVTGGIAYISAVCDDYYGFGVSQVAGDFNLAYPSQIWDVVVFTHELGHTVGSQHSHCYDPPLDRCYNKEPGCYGGPIVASHGSIMSYCHTLPGGLANIDLLFPSPIVAVVRQTVAQVSCLAPVSASTCGDGTLDPGEQCDDGNTTVGDGCSAACRLEVCGNGLLDPGEQCDDHNTVGGDGCSAGCRVEACGNGVLDPGEQCDDGNTAAQDGCAADCTIERCPVLIAHQRDWASAQLTVEPREPGDQHLSLRGAFAIPATADVDVVAQGITVLFTDTNGVVTFGASVPGRGGWKQRGERAIYRDRGGTVAGIRKATVRLRRAGTVRRVKIAVSGVGGSYPTSLASMPHDVTVLLGDASAVVEGACGRRTFGPTTCRSSNDGRRLLCK